MIQDAILGKPNECIYGTPESTVSMIYVRDAARAADMVLQASKENIKMANYNVTGVPDAVSVKELEAILKRRFPKTTVTYKTDSLSQTGFYKALSVMKVFDDSYARKEWDWKAKYATPEAIIDIFEKDMKEYPRRYGVA